MGKGSLGKRLPQTKQKKSLKKWKQAGAGDGLSTTFP